MKIKKIITCFITVLALVTSLPGLAEVDDSVQEEDTLEEKLESTQDTVSHAQDRYNHTQRQYERVQNAEDVDDYLEVVKKIEIFS